MVNAGNGLAAVTLAAGEVGPGRVNVTGFRHVAVLAAPPPIELNPRWESARRVRTRTWAAMGL